MIGDGIETDPINSNPTLITSLRNLQLRYTKIQAELSIKLCDLERQYAEEYSPLYEKRKLITSTKCFLTEVECNFQLDDDSKDPSLEEDSLEVPESSQGVPDFWLTVFKNVREIDDLIKSYDEPILKEMIDVKVLIHDFPKSFTIEFHFLPNEYFTNTILTKTYNMMCCPSKGEPCYFKEPIMKNCVGCTIDWMEGKNVTAGEIIFASKFNCTVKKINARVSSFFNFFAPYCKGIDESNWDANAHLQLKKDFEIGYLLHKSVVPQAVLYYTGELKRVLDNDDGDLEEECDSQAIDNNDTETRGYEFTLGINENGDGLSRTSDIELEVTDGIEHEE